MIVVTGGAGFIGANIVKALNARGRNDVMVVDDLRDGTKFVNLADCTLADYLDKDDFLAKIEAALRGEITDLPNIEAIFHEGACSDTTEWDGQYMMKNNFEYSKVLLNYCEKFGIPSSTHHPQRPMAAVTSLKRRPSTKNRLMSTVTPSCCLINMCAHAGSR